jgi:hypothetical protein
MDIRGEFNSDLAVEGLALDRMQAKVDALKLEMFPDTAVDTINDWTRTRGVNIAQTAALQEKRDAVVAKERSWGARKAEHFYAIADALGFYNYNETPSAPYVRFVEGEYPGFVVGYSIVGVDVICDDSPGHCRYTVSVYGTHVSGSTGDASEIARANQLQALFQNAHTLGITFVFIDE